MSSVRITLYPETPVSKPRAGGDNPEWSASELLVLQRFYPDYEKIQRMLPHRTFAALKKAALRYDVSEQRHVWTNAETARLRELYRSPITDALLDENFPGLGAEAIRRHASHLKLKAPRAYKRTGLPLVDEISDHCSKLKITLADLDRDFLNGKRYFRTGLKERNVNYNVIMKVIEGLGGKVTVTFPDTTAS